MNELSKRAGLNESPGLVKGPGLSNGPGPGVLPLVIAPAVEFGVPAPAGGGEWLLAGGTPQTALVPGGSVHPQQEAVRDGASAALAARGSLGSRVGACRDTEGGETSLSGRCSGKTRLQHKASSCWFIPSSALKSKTSKFRNPSLKRD